MKPALRPLSRAYHFGSSSFAAAFGELPDAGSAYQASLRAGALALARAHDPQAWGADDPVVTLLRGEALRGGTSVETRDAFGHVNGALIHATPAEVDAVVAHVRAYTPPTTDLRAPIRELERELARADEGGHAAALVANQVLDFGKQDGVTELVETVEASAVERRLADALAADEAAGRVRVCRAPAFVACVSNFSNFLDLSRKVLRNLELGVPVVVLSRAHTAQHCYRWAQLVVAGLGSHGVDAGMFTFLAADVAEQQRAIEACPPASPLYFTGSRAVASSIKAYHERTFASTGGPNTLVASSLTPQVAEAIRLSATIENAGQCTALRHAVVPCKLPAASNALKPTPLAASATDALGEAQFAALLAEAAPREGGPGFAPSPDAADGWVSVTPATGATDGAAAHVRWRGAAEGAPPPMPPAELEEHWRRATVDFSAPPSAEALRSEAWLRALSDWLVAAQPISVAVSDDDPDFRLALELFGRTAVVVFTAGTLELPALTCQARPQDGECFGEVPPRRSLRAHTAAPVIVPSPTPAYNTCYAPDVLADAGRAWAADGAAAAAAAPPAARALAKLVKDDGVRGYLAELWSYLLDACTDNPKRGQGADRTSLFGLQAPPKGAGPTLVRISESDQAAAASAAGALDGIAPHLFPFVASSASDAVCVSVAPEARAITAALADAGVLPPSALAVESDTQFMARVSAERPFNVLDGGARREFARAHELLGGPPLAGQFVCSLLCFGHAKSTAPNDEAFVKAFTASPKWLRVATP